MKKQVSVRLSDLEVEKLDVLAMGGSREGLFKIALRLMAERRVRLNELAIESFRQAQGSLIVLASASESWGRSGPLNRLPSGYRERL